jgi:hypothetical protein
MKSFARYRTRARSSIRWRAGFCQLRMRMEVAAGFGSFTRPAIWSRSAPEQLARQSGCTCGAPPGQLAGDPRAPRPASTGCARHCRCSLSSRCRKSHSKSQRGQASGHSHLHSATLQAVQVPSEPRLSDAQRRSEGDWGVKGSPVQIRPSRLVAKFFRMYLCPTESQQKSLSPQKMARKRGADRGSRCPYQGICQYGRASEVG